MSDLNDFLDHSDDDSHDTTEDVNDHAAADIDMMQADEHDDDDVDMNVDANGIVRAEDLFAMQAETDSAANGALPTPMVEHAMSVSFDLGHLSCYDPGSIDIDELCKHRKTVIADANNTTRAALNPNDARTKLSQIDYEVRALRERYLYDLTRSNVQAMVNKMHSLQPVKTGPSDEPGIVVKLPSGRCKLPRSKPIPEERPKTRWETFAARKGIRTGKKSRELLQWDEDKQEWLKSYGYKKANDASAAPIYEHKENDWDTTNPWLRMKKEKAKRVAINKENKLRNLKEALGDRVSGTLDLQSAMNRSKYGKKKEIGNRALNAMDKDKHTKYGHLNVALKVAQHSTASMGKFDELNRDESKPDQMKNRKKSVDYMQSNENSKVHQYRHGKESFANKERSKQHEILFNIFGKQQAEAFNVEKAVKHEQYQITKKRAVNKKGARSRKKK